jgi:hypothetical protein
MHLRLQSAPPQPEESLRKRYLLVAAEVTDAASQEGPAFAKTHLTAFRVFFLILALVIQCSGQQTSPSNATAKVRAVPPRVLQAERFLASRNFRPGYSRSDPVRSPVPLARAMDQSASATSSWQPLGPVGVVSPNYGLVSGRISSLALDPSDPTGNTLYVGTTGGGLWLSTNAGTSNSAIVDFNHLTDSVDAFTTAPEPSISIGAVTVQPGGTGVVLAGTGDTNDALDSYYGSGILRSSDGGTTWTLIQNTSDKLWSFLGEGFAGFAWSTTNQNLVVAAVSQAWKGVTVDALRSNLSYEGLYYSTDAGVNWSLARIADQTGTDIQGPTDAFVGPDGNAATSVVWNPVRQLFLAAVRFHGYYQSTDGMNWTRLTAQPGAGLTTALCPTNSLSIGSQACPMFRGTLAVNPVTGDTFAWTVDLNDQDQGIWQDVCARSGNSCTNSTITFARQWNTTALESATSLGSATIFNGDYNLALAAIPSSQDTILLAGDNDVWQCSLAMDCTWRNTTNAFTCMSAAVGGYQHAFVWNPNYPLEVFVGNDSGLWRSMDAIAETGSSCSAADASHFQNLNGALGSLAEVESMSPVGASPYTMMTGLGANGTAVSSSTTGPTTDWPQILGGEGGPVAVDPSNPSNWYVNNGAGVSIHACSKGAACASADFGLNPTVSNADVSNDGLIMPAPAPFLVDPFDPSQLLVGTCRVWRGPAIGGWTSANAISPMFDGNRSNPACSGNALIRSLAAMKLSNGGEVVYAGTYGSSNGGGSLPGHVLSATMSPGGVWSGWQDLTLNPVSNDTLSLNHYNLDISSLTLDPHDPTGNTLYVTVAGIPNPRQLIQIVYRSSDGGAHWSSLKSNLPSSPANSVAIDPLDPNTTYLALDMGVYATRNVASCATAGSACWSAYGAGLPMAPVVTLSAAPANSSLAVLVAGTYGRGVWQIPLATAGVQLTTVTVNPASLDFGHEGYNTISAVQTVTLTNTGGIALAVGQIATTGDFATGNCSNITLNAGARCDISVTFTPTQAGARSGRLIIPANVDGFSIAVPLIGTGDPPGVITLAPPSLNFGQVKVGTSSIALQVTVTNSGGTAVPVTSLTVLPPFSLSSNTCGATSIAPNTSCQLLVQFQPTQTGAATGTLTLVDGAGTQTVQLNGTGAAPPTDTLSTGSLAFPPTVIGQSSSSLNVTLTNSGDLPLTSITAAVSGPFQTSNNCTTQLIGHSSCTISVTFVPEQAGPATGTLTVSDILKSSQTVALNGTGLLPPAFTLTPTAISFSPQQVGVASAPQTLSVANSGGAPMANVGFQITGPSAPSFSTGTTTCGSTLANGSNCTVQVIFDPVASGGAAATLTATSSSPGTKPASIALTGNGQGNVGLNVSPPQLTFAAQVVGQPSAAQTVTLSNTASVAAGGLSFSINGPFTVSQNPCTVTLPPGASCAVAIVFTPTTTGPISGLLTINSTNLPISATVALNGIGGLSGAIQITPSPLTFPMTGVSATSNSATVTITNIATAFALADVALSVSPEFKLVSTTCAGSLAAGASCTAAVAFAPLNSGRRSGALTVSSSTLVASATDVLSGSGFDFQVTASGASSQSIASGQTASYSLNITTTASVPTSFSFLCGTLPLYAACVFNPSSATVPGGATGSEAVQVTTGQTQSASARPLVRRDWPIAALIFGFLMRPAARRRARGFTLLLLAACLTLASSSCSSSGGGTSGGSPAPSPTTHSTPAGTYSIPVTVSSNGVQHIVTLTLVVD